MADGRRYSEHEIAAIFKQAAETQEAAHEHLSNREGLTLAELQQIGNEAGITPAFIARAAAAVDRTVRTPPPTTHFGVPVSAARTVDLPGPLSEGDWDRIVVDLRETFQARGSVRHEGSLREWRNGNLYALAEPTASGHRLRLGTVKGNAQNTFFGGLAFFVLGLALMLMMLLSGDFLVEVKDTFMAALFAVMGLGSIGVTAYRLPRWAEERGRQMEAVAARAAERMADQRVPTLRNPDAPPRLDLDTQRDHLTDASRE